jgi:hypothetical protein
MINDEMVLEMSGSMRERFALLFQVGRIWCEHNLRSPNVGVFDEYIVLIIGWHLAGGW